MFSQDPHFTVASLSDSRVIFWEGGHSRRGTCNEAMLYDAISIPAYSILCALEHWPSTTRLFCPYEVHLPVCVQDGLRSGVPQGSAGHLQGDRQEDRCQGQHQQHVAFMLSLLLTMEGGWVVLHSFGTAPGATALGCRSSPSRWRSLNGSDAATPPPLCRPLLPRAPASSSTAPTVLSGWVSSGSWMQWWWSLGASFRVESLHATPSAVFVA